MELLSDGTVLKSPFPDAEMEDHILDIAKEASIYHRVGPHERLVRILGHSRDGLILEYMKNGDLKTYLQAQNSIPMSLKLNWAYQIAQVVSLLHNNGIIHCDIKSRNFLLDATLNIKIIDFSGSSLDGSKPASGEGTRFYLPRNWRDPPTLATDLFALGSTLYEVLKEPAPTKRSLEIKWKNFSRGRSFLMFMAFHAEISSNSVGCPKSIQPKMCRLSSKAQFAASSVPTVSLISIFWTFLRIWTVDYLHPDLSLYTSS